MKENSGELERLAHAVGLSKTERAVFERLAADVNELVAREELLSILRGSSPHTIDSHIMAIRRKLQDNRLSLVVKTVKGSGFVLVMGNRRPQ